MPKALSEAPTSPPVTLAAHFGELKDPRQPGKCDHKLLDIVMIAICAVLSSAEGWEDVARFGRAKETWLKQFLELPNGIPSHDTFGRVFARLNPEAFAGAFSRWVGAVVGKLDGVVAIDGKTLRRSYDRRDAKAAIHMVNAWAAENGLVLGQVKTDAKSNEITAIPLLLEQLAIEGCLVTIDAMGCQRQIAEQIVAQGGDYLLAVKANQQSLHQHVLDVFEQAEAQADANPIDYLSTQERAHGRHEARHYGVMTLPTPVQAKLSQRWASLTSIGFVETERDVDGQRQHAFRYYISSATLTAERFAEATRAHWGVENKVHWVLDVSFREDDSRVRRGYAAENLSRLRQIALNLIKADTSVKDSVRGKRLRAAWDENYMSNLLFS